MGLHLCPGFTFSEFVTLLDCCSLAPTPLNLPPHSVCLECGVLVVSLCQWAYKPLEEPLLPFYIIKVKVFARSSFSSYRKVSPQPSHFRSPKFNAMSTHLTGGFLTYFGPLSRPAQLPQEIIDLIWYYAFSHDTVETWKHLGL